jgi:hypothetical protein
MTLKKYAEAHEPYNGLRIAYVLGKDPSKSSSVKAKEAVVEPFRGV